MVKSRRQRRTRRKTKKQRGGRVDIFQVYLFTKSQQSDQDKQILQDILENLYGDVNEIRDFRNFPNDYMKEEIQNFVYSKRKYYPSLKTITGFSIAIPKRLNEGVMNDDKLTREEYAIRDALVEKEAPFKLVEAQHGLWGEGTAIIALEKRQEQK